MADEQDTIEGVGKVVDGHVAKLMEHFETVRIFCTRQVKVNGSMVTLNVTRGAGNAFAQQGQVDEWLMVSKHQTLLNIEDAHESQDNEEDGAGA